MGTKTCIDASRASTRRRSRRRRSGGRGGRGMLFRRLRREDGQAMAEFAMIVPVVLLIVVGIIYLGRILTYMSDETHLAEIAVRFAAVNQDPNCSTSTTPNNCTAGNLASYVVGTQQVVRSEFSDGATGESAAVTSGAQVCVTAPNGGTGAQGTPIQATAKATFQILPFLNWNATISESATQMMEQNADSSIYTNDYSGTSC